MEKLLLTNWDRTKDETQSFFIQDTFNHTSAAYHHVHEIMQTPWPFTEKKKQGLEDLNARKWQPSNLKREIIDGPGGQGDTLLVHPPRPFPKRSSLSASEQKDYYYSLLRISKAFLYGTEVNPPDLMRFKELYQTLNDEFKEFQDFAKTIILQNPMIYSYLSPGVSKYVTEAWKNGKQSVLTYAKHYANRGNLLLIPKENMKSLDLVLENNLLDLGKIPSPIFPPVNKVFKLQRTYKAMNKRFPVENYQKINNKVSSDINAIRLASKYEADIIASSETLKALAGTNPPLFRRSWTIPFTVIQASGKNKKVIVFDDPLIPTSMTGYEKNNFFNRLAAKFQFTCTFKSRYYYYPGTEDVSAEEEEEEQDFDEDIFDINKVHCDEIDTFGVEEPSNKKKSSPNRNDDSKTKSVISTSGNGIDENDSIESDSSEALMIDLGDGDSPKKRKSREKVDEHKESNEGNQHENPPNKKKAHEKSAPNTDESSNILGTILKEQEKLIQKNLSKEITGNKENPKSYIQPRGNQNFSYKSWLLKGNHKTFRLLIRTSVDTAVVTPNSGAVKTFVIAAKSEYQPWFGSECLTPQEIFETWIDLHLRPGAKLFRVRVDSYTGDFMAAEQKDEACIKKEINFQYGDHLRCEQCLTTNWAVFSSLYEMDLAVGTYLLRHGENDGVSVQVLEAVDEEHSSFNLHEAYETVNTEETSIKDPNEQWIALDPFMMLPVHRALERPPVTFEPSNDAGRPPNRKKIGKKKKQQQKKKTPTKKAK